MTASVAKRNIGNVSYLGMVVDLDAFSAYMEYTWVGTRSSDPLFPILSWNQHDASLMKLPRCTNMAEGWHNAFNSMLVCTHPLIWRLLDALRKEQNLTRIKLGRMRQLEDLEILAAKWVRFDNRIQQHCDSYHTQPNVLEYLRRCANIC